MSNVRRLPTKSERDRSRRAHERDILDLTDAVAKIARLSRQYGTVFDVWTAKQFEDVSESYFAALDFLRRTDA